ncbi:CocE/NonD family hydrolase [Adlercreutzia sp. ZJ242]|uniref:CocE/NonD family hydrolase n=1 Tax=Adlercreutzia sp. ZJ242 TaxID=2709409 RepID=UPI0013EBF3DB|nr:CocE/NonD family hydrolase [Adlercreutzia sp. ZJ242]
MVESTLEGRFVEGPVCGLRYDTQTHHGLTDEAGTFLYEPGETVTFCVGDLILGSVSGREEVTCAHLTPEVLGNVKRIANRKVTNRSRFLQSLDVEGDLEQGVTITEGVANVVSAHKYEINFDTDEISFEAETKALFAEIGGALRSPAAARNELRRTLMGIKRLVDVKIPLRDGAYVLGDVFMPAKPGAYPVLLSMGGYGKAFWFGNVADEAEAALRETMEDDYFEGKPAFTGFIPFHIGIAGDPLPPAEALPPMGSPMNPPLPHISERFERANSCDWVPHGYVVIHIDGRGTGSTPGTYKQFSLEEARDLYDSIEWAAAQPWSNGSVGLYGASYYAMNAFSTAALQPPHLKAMIALAGDSDSFRDVIFGNGGLYNPFNFIAHVHCKGQEKFDWLSEAKAHPFFDEALYGPEGTISPSLNLDNVKVPFWTSIPLEAPIHIRGTSEIFTHSASTDKKMTIISEPGIHFWMYGKDHLDDHRAFLDHWLKGVDNGIMDEPPVNIMVRTGWGSYYWRRENEWPLPGTQYKKLYLDASDGLVLRGEVAQADGSVSYAAEGQDTAVFTSAPFEEDVTIIGQLKLNAWVESTSYDMALDVNLRVCDENGQEVIYSCERATPAAFGGGRPFPLSKGGLKVSHRKLDEERSTDARPFHTHLERDYQPLREGEIVECQVEILPTTAVIKKGWTLKLIFQPWHDEVDPEYEKGATYTVHAGPERISYLQLPVIPC